MPTTNQEPFVERVEMAIMQYVILNKAQQGEVTRDNLKQAFKGNLQMSGDHFDHCITQLVEDGHLKEIGGNKYTVTDDGREDVQKLQHIMLELPNVIQKGGQQQKQGIPQTTGGGSSTSGTTGNQGSYGSSKQGGAGQQSGSNQPGNVGGQQKSGDVNKGGSSSTQNR